MGIFDQFRLDGRVALLTGAGRGIGLSIARALAEAGARVVIQDLARDVAEQAAASIRESGASAAAIGGDATAIADVERWPAEACAAIGGADGVDILVNNVSVQGWHKLDEWKLDEADRILRTNVLGPWRLTQLCAPHMRGRRWGRVLNVGSIQALRGNAEMSPYAASKAALDNLTRSFARALGEHGITVNAIAPGMVDTLRNRGEFERRNGDNSAKWLPLRRTSVPEDMAGAALLLCSDAGAYITGAVIPVDGGMHL
jgi:NAD(P)-dependent dehydrogenase (short-subunit alcohol dehydrogenase family)